MQLGSARGAFIRVASSRPRGLRPAAAMSGAASGAGGGDAGGKIVTDPAEIRKIVLSAKRVAVLGIKTEAKADQPAYYVPEYLQSAGVEIVPVPVFFPEATEILGSKVYRRLADIPPPPLDIVDVFRKPSDLAGHLEDILAARPKVVWLQAGISEPGFEAAVAAAGIKVVANRCMLVEHRAAKAGL
ncbi:hypothetical protein Rsub_10820 [Raphidocelis subcapitata]|uniref:CoA-binding domain-containing protein n=1 Tax=Raphidocelis subcapitata TaxID=307507 RepID=A0A2V0PFN1_9CHLO|nr:hypothetical protein Rsub_10820 [Raphidocelis subcapitata]|eukprot:GBF98631.1 hypothetical protein Rsub_10820 [Raphidocelis subcapitata]